MLGVRDDESLVGEGILIMLLLDVDRVRGLRARRLLLSVDDKDPDRGNNNGEYEFAWKTPP